MALKYGKDFKQKLFYGWVIVIIAVIVACLLSGIRFSFGVFFKHFEEEFFLSRWAVSSIYSGFMVFSGIFAIVGGWCLDKYGSRLIVSLLGVLTGFSLILMSQASSLWQLFLCYSLLFSMSTGSTYPVLVAAVSKWFHKKRGFALGIASSGSGIGAIAVVPACAFLIENIGWRPTCVFLGVTTALVVVSLSRLLYNLPEDKGTLSNGRLLQKITSKDDNTNVYSKLSEISLSDALKSKNFFFLLCIAFSSSFCVHLILTHIVPYITDFGISSIEAASVISVIGVFNIIAKLLIGRLSDLIGRKIPAICSAMLRAAALLTLIWARELWLFYAFAIAFGLSWGGFAVTIISLCVDIFDGRNIGAIIGSLEGSHYVGGAIGSVSGGILFDIQNSYALAFVIGACFMGLASINVAKISLEKNRLSQVGYNNNA